MRRTSRKPVAAVVTAVVAACLFAALGAGCSGTSDVQGYVPPEKEPGPARFGITEMRMPDANTLALLEDSEAQILKCDGDLAVSWNEIETPGGSYDWMAVDERLAVLSDTGLELVVCVYANRYGAEESAGFMSEAWLADYARFAGALAERYDGDGQNDGPAGVRVAVWQMEDEADVTWAGRPADYARAFRTAAEALREAAPEARVMMAGASPEASARGFYESVLSELRQQGAGHGVFHLFDFHSIGAADGSYRQVGRQAALYRQMLDHFGFGDVAVAMTETGTWSGDPAGEEWAAQSEPLQAIDLVRRYVMAHGNGVEFANWLSFREWDLPEEEPDYLNHLGLVHNPIHTGAVGPKRAFETFGRMVREFGEATIQEELTGLPAGFHGVRLTKDYYEQLILWSDAVDGNPRLVTVPWPYSSGQVTPLVRGERREEAGWIFPARNGFLDVRLTNVPVVIRKPDL